MQPKTLYYAVAVALIAIATIGVVAMYANNEEPEPAPTYSITLDCSNSALMHSYGLPTKADVIQWHVFGKWGFTTDGETTLFEELPGDSGAWDNLYHIVQKPNYKR